MAMAHLPVQATCATSIPQRIARRVARPRAKARGIHGAGTPLEVVTVAIHLVESGKEGYNYNPLESSTNQGFEHCSDVNNPIPQFLGHEWKYYLWG